MPSPEVLSPDSGQSEKSPKAGSRVRWRWIIAGVCLLVFAFLLQLVANIYYANAKTSRSDSFDHPVAFSSDKLNKELRSTNNLNSNETQTTSKVNLSAASLMINAGDRWEKELYKNIDNCDVVYLFWSEAAKKSKWVTEEVLYAHELQTGGKDATPPDIIPIPLEGPPAVAPPEELKFLHFNDEFIYLIYGAEAEKKAPDL